MKTKGKSFTDAKKAINKLMKRKHVDMKWLLQCAEFGNGGYLTYNAGKKEKHKLSKDEFEIILIYYNGVEL